MRLAQLEFEAREGETLAHMAFDDDVVAALLEAARAHGVEMIRGAVAGFGPGRDVARIDLADGGSLSARGSSSRPTARARNCARSRKFRPSAGRRDRPAIVATIAHERDHHGRAEQHFLPSGPFAILPLPGPPVEHRLEREPRPTPRRCSRSDRRISWSNWSGVSR